MRRLAMLMAVIIFVLTFSMAYSTGASEMPTKWFISGDRDKAIRELTGLGKRALYKVKNWRKISNLFFFDSGWIVYADGSRVRAASFGDYDHIYIHAIGGKKKMVEEREILGLVLQWDSYVTDGAPSYPGIFGTIQGMNVGAYKWVRYPQDPIPDYYRYQGNYYNGGIVENNGTYGYGFGQYDVIFQLKPYPPEVLNALELKSDYSTLNYHAFDDTKNILYVALANGSNKSDVYKVFTRDTQGNPALSIDKHITTDIHEWISHLAVNPRKNILYGARAGVQEKTDSSCNGTKVTFTTTMSAPVASAAVGLLQVGGPTVPYFVGCDNGSSNLVDCLNWPDGIPMASGTVNHTTGAISITFSSPPPTGSIVYFWSSPAEMIMYDATTLDKLGTFSFPANKTIASMPLSIIDDKDNLIAVSYPSPYPVNKFSYDGTLLGQLILPSTDTPYVLAYGGTGKYAYLAVESYIAPDMFIRVHRIDIEDMSIINTISFSRTPDNHPYVLSVDPVEKSVYLINCYVNNVYKISGDLGSYKDLAEDHLHDYEGFCGFTTPYNWNPFCARLGMSNKAIYRKNLKGVAAFSNVRQTM